MVGATEKLNFNFHLKTEHSFHWEVFLDSAVPRLLSMVKLFQWEVKATPKLTFMWC